MHIIQFVDTYIAFVVHIAGLVDGEIEEIHQVPDDLDRILQGHLHAASLNLRQKQNSNVARSHGQGRGFITNPQLG